MIVFSISLSLYSYSQENVKVKKIEFKTENTEGLNEAWKSIKQGDKYFKEGKGTYRDARNQYLSANEYNPENAELNYKIQTSRKTLKIPLFFGHF